MLEAAGEYLVLVVLRKIHRKKVVLLVSGVLKQRKEFLLLQEVRTLRIQIVLGGLVVGGIQNDEHTVLTNHAGNPAAQRLNKHEDGQGNPARYMSVPQAEGNKPGLIQDFHMTQIVQQENGSRPRFGVRERLAVAHFKINYYRGYQDVYSVTLTLVKALYEAPPDSTIDNMEWEFDHPASD